MIARKRAAAEEVVEPPPPPAETLVSRAQRLDAALQALKAERLDLDQRLPNLERRRDELLAAGADPAVPEAELARFRVLSRQIDELAPKVADAWSAVNAERDREAAEVLELEAREQAARWRGGLESLTGLAARVEEAEAELASAAGRLSQLREAGVTVEALDLIGLRALRQRIGRAVRTVI